MSHLVLYFIGYLFCLVAIYGQVHANGNRFNTSESLVVCVGMLAWPATFPLLLLTTLALKMGWLDD